MTIVYSKLKEAKAMGRLNWEKCAGETEVRLSKGMFEKIKLIACLIVLVLINFGFEQFDYFNPYYAYQAHQNTH